MKLIVKATLIPGAEIIEEDNKKIFIEGIVVVHGVINFAKSNLVKS
ncbi:hypothetical protein [Ureibacillus sp. GCM10028918]